MKQKAGRWYLIMALILIIALFTSGIWWLKKPSHEVIKLGSYTITQDHLSLYENDCRAEVTSYYYNTYQMDPNEEEFWDKDIEGETPRQRLKQMAEKRLLKDTAERVNASRYGIVCDITLKDMKKSLEEENKNRQSASAIAYGPGQYGLMEYISRTQMEIRDELKGKLLEGELKPSKEQLLELYASADPALFDKGCKARVGIYMYYGMKVGEYPDELEQIWHEVDKGLAEGKEPADIISQTNKGSQIMIEYEEAEYDTDDFPRDNQQLAWLAEQTQHMEPGQYSGVLNYGASQGILKVLSKEDYGTLDYEESIGIVTSLWLEKAYEEYIEQSMKDLNHT